MGELDMEELMEETEDAELVYTFNKKTFLVEEISIEDFKVSSETELEGTPAEVSMSLETSFEFSKYDELDEDDYMVSKSIKKDAIDEDDVEKTEDKPEAEVEKADAEEDKPEAEVEKPQAEEDKPDAEEVEPETESDNPEKGKETEADNSSKGGSGDTYSINGPDGSLCTIYCPSYLVVEEETDYGVTITSADGLLYLHISSLMPSWAEDYLGTGSFEKDEEFYSYQNVEVYGSVDTEQGEVTILKYDYQLSGFDFGCTDYCAVLYKGEYSPSFTIEQSNLEDLGVSIEQITCDIFGEK